MRRGRDTTHQIGAYVRIAHFNGGTTGTVTLDSMEVKYRHVPGTPHWVSEDTNVGADAVTDKLLNMALAANQEVTA